MAVLRGLRNLEGSEWVEKVVLKDGNRSFSASISEKVALNEAAIRKGAGRPVSRIEVAVTGEVSWTGDDAWLTCRGNGQKIRLRNRPATDRKDAPDDVLGEIRTKMKDGRALFEVAGGLQTADNVLYINLTGARSLR